MNLLNKFRPAFTRFKKVPVSEKQQLYSIGIFTGKSPFELIPPPNNLNPVLTRNDIIDVKALFVADPFMIKVENIWYMFFEIYNGSNGKGEIGSARSPDGLKWAYDSVVLEEPFHLSYPYVFSWEDEIYMIPEAGSSLSIRIYKAKNFPLAWEFIGTLLSGQQFLDSSIIFYDNLWWLFTEAGGSFRFDTLRLFFADNLHGKWTEHPQSPVIKGNPHIARPAGRINIYEGKLVRYTQDCYPRYGTQVRAFQIEISKKNYQETEALDRPILVPSKNGWNADGMHHIDAHSLHTGEWLACVDGWIGVDTLG
jgi:hypothetical protein